MAVPDIQLDRTAKADGSRNWGAYTDHPGLYPAFDRFGRVIKHMWVDGGFTTTTGADPTYPPVAAFDYTYDEASNRTSRYNVDPVIDHWIARDEDFYYDGLDRLSETWRGQRRSGSPADGNAGNFDGANFDGFAGSSTQYSPSQAWALDDERT